MLLTLLMISPLAISDIAVIVHPSNTNKLSVSQIKRVYLGQLKAYPDKSRVKPFDQKEGSLIREMFGSAILKKNKQQLKRYWARIVFTGTGTPPEELTSDLEVKTAVSKNPAAIGYIDSANVDESVKIIHRF